ncbi:MAG: hypothetical protein H6673_01705 [Anaerolineales bacterium]|nr:hypothetical protein [Anaerolineales bacterium]
MTDLDQNLIDEFVTISHTANFGKIRQLLIKHPDLVEAESTWGETALAAALHAGQEHIAEFLRSAGAEHICTGACQVTIKRLPNNYREIS